MTDAAPIPAHIEYLIVPADQGAAAVNYLRRSPEGSAAIRASTRRVAIILFVLGFLFSAVVHTWEPAEYGAVVALLAYLLFPRYADTSVRGTIARRGVAGLCPCGGGRHRMEASEAGLRVTCDAADTLRPWSTITRLDDVPEHVFVIVQGGQGYPVLRETMLGGDLDGFVRSARAYLERRPALFE